MSAAVQNKYETFRRELATLFEENYQLIFRAALRVTGSPQDAEDVLQTVFVRLIEKQPSTDFVKNPPGYLYRSAINEALDLVKARGRRRLTGDDPDSLEIPAPAAEPDREEVIQRMEAAMAKLRPEYVQLLHLHYKEEYSCRKIAKLLRRPVGAVFKDLSRARAELKGLLQNQEENCETRQGKHQTGRKPVLADASEI